MSHELGDMDFGIGNGGETDVTKTDNDDARENPPLEPKPVASEEEGGAAEKEKNGPAGINEDVPMEHYRGA